MGYGMTGSSSDTAVSKALPPLKGAALGVLLQRESYGYEIANMLERQLGEDWSVSRSTLYRMLKDMVEEGLIESGSPGETVSDRIMYRSTALAEALFVQWMESPLSAEHGPLQLQARMVVARRRDLPGLLAVLNDYERVLFARRQEIEETMPLPPQRSFPSSPPLLRSTMMFLVRQAPLQRVAGELVWVDISRRTIHAAIGSPGR